MRDRPFSFHKFNTRKLNAITNPHCSSLSILYSNSSLVSINLSQWNQRSPWARVTGKNLKRRCISLLMARANKRTSHASTLMEDCVTLNGATTSEKSVNIRYSSATVKCHNSILPTPNSGSGFRGSAATTESTRKKRQLL